MTMNARAILFWSALAVLTSCSRMAPDQYPAGTPVSLTMRMVSPEPFQLGPKSSQLFLNMLTNQPVHSEISQMPAAPMGTFMVAGTHYLWHGNGVIRGTGRHERLWYGPYVQRLIIEIMHREHSTRESVQHILDALEQDGTVATTSLQGPGQYPGGANNALHPAHLVIGDTNGWQVFHPQTNEP
jgi:hypothetical protein